jgi:putative membrane protein
MESLSMLSTTKSSFAAALAASAGDEMVRGTMVRMLVETAIFVGIGLLVFVVAFFLMTKLAPFSVRKEIEDDQNTALGIVMGSVIIGLAIIIAAAIGGG